MGKVISIEERRERKARLEKMKQLLKPILERYYKKYLLRGFIHDEAWRLALAEHDKNMGRKPKKT